MTVLPTLNTVLKTDQKTQAPKPRTPGPRKPDMWKYTDWASL